MEFQGFFNLKQKLTQNFLFLKGSGAADKAVTSEKAQFTPAVVFLHPVRLTSSQQNTHNLRLLKSHKELSFPRRRESRFLNNSRIAGQRCGSVRCADSLIRWIPAAAGMTVVIDNLTR
jgi:hypothetical protein